VRRVPRYLRHVPQPMDVSGPGMCDVPRICVMFLIPGDSGPGIRWRSTVCTWRISLALLYSVVEGAHLRYIAVGLI
jgi:hypothetical protein